MSRRKSDGAMGVACDICKAGVGVRCAEGVRYKSRVKKVGRSRMCQCGLAESLHGDVAHAFSPETIVVEVYSLVDKRCKAARIAKARDAKKAELDGQRDMFAADVMDFKDAFGDA